MPNLYRPVLIRDEDTVRIEVSRDDGDTWQVSEHNEPVDIDIGYTSAATSAVDAVTSDRVMTVDAMREAYGNHIIHDGATQQRLAAQAQMHRRVREEYINSIHSPALRAGVFSPYVSEPRSKDYETIHEDLSR